jgi:hypothetical protein
MQKLILLVLLLETGMALRAQPGRFIVDDDSYTAQVVLAGEKLLRENKLVPLDSLRSQVRRKAFAIKALPVSHEKLEPPELCERLRESTLAVGTLYKCPDCGGWHFSGSTGFVVSEDGIVSTCCHVLMEDSDPKVAVAFLIAADSTGRVFPVQSVLAADTDADTCFLSISGTGLKPLPLRAGVRPGESVYCLSNPGGYFFMFTQGLIARLNRRANTDGHGHSNGVPSRPILLLNITAEFAPGSSGAPVVDSCGNVVGQVASIADAGETSADDEDQPTSPSVPIRFCTAAEEILRLSSHSLVNESRGQARRTTKKPKQKVH